MLQHEDLEFGEFLEKVDVADGLVFDVACSVLEVVTGCGTRQRNSPKQDANLLPSATISSTNQIFDLSSRFLFPFTSC